MRGSRRIGLLAISLVCMFAFMAASAFGDAEDQLLNAKGGTLLRDVKTTPVNQPDALEFVNNGNVVLKTSVGTLTCTEVEFGTTVLNAKATATTEVELAVPFGVAEGPEDCTVPTYFDTLATGAVGNSANGKVASVSIADSGAGTEIVATLHNLKFSQNITGIGFCTGNLDGVKGKVENSEGPFVEEAPPNLNVQFTEKELTVSGTGCPTTAKLTANFFLETPSTSTETAWFAS